MKKKLLTMILVTMLFATACGNPETPTELSASVEASAAVQGETEATKQLADKGKQDTAEEATKKSEVPGEAQAASKAPAEAAPVVSATPESTQAPVATAKPKEDEKAVEATKSEAPGKAEETAKAEATKKPEATPKATEQPKAEATPKPTPKPTPEPTPEPVHTCSFDDGKTTRDATCNSEGEITYSCSCGKTRSESIPKTSHNYVSETKEPTCTEEGSTVEVCTNCGDTKSGGTIAALGHDYEKDYPTGGESSCRGGAYYVVSCSRCGDVSEDGHDDPLPCDYEEREISAGDCRTPSVIEYTCKNCGHSYSAEGSTNDDHDWITVQEAPTYDVATNQIIPGEEVTVCSRCDARK